MATELWQRNSASPNQLMGRPAHPPRTLRRFAAMHTIVSMLFLVSHVLGAQNDTSTTDSANPFVASNATEQQAGDVLPLNVTEVGSANEANPFSPEGEDDRICCCQINNSTQYNAYQYQEFAPGSLPPECCCGSPGVDCPDVCGNTGFSSVCGSGQVCGVLLLMAALIGTLSHGAANGLADHLPGTLPNAWVAWRACGRTTATYNSVM